jgi:integrase
LLETANTRFMGDYRAHLLVAAAAGLRRGEICALRWSDLDMATGVLTVGRAIEVQRPKPYKLVEKPPKNNRTEDVALPQIVLDALAEHGVAQARRLVGVRSSTPIFDDDGKTMNPDKLGKRIAAIVKRSGLKMRPLHDLRHAFGSWMTNDDVPSRIVQKQMRHSDPRMTARYTKHIDEGARRAADKMDTRLRGVIRGDGSPDGSLEGVE